MQQNFMQSLGAAVEWDADSKYQICNVYGQGQIFLYQYVPLVTDGGDLYQLTGNALNDGTPPASDPAYKSLAGGAASMLPLPEDNMYVGNTSNQPAAQPANAYILNQLLTGYSSQSGSITGGTTVLNAIEILNGNLASTTATATAAQTSLSNAFQGTFGANSSTLSNTIVNLEDGGRTVTKAYFYDATTLNAGLAAGATGSIIFTLPANISQILYASNPSIISANTADVVLNGTISDIDGVTSIEISVQNTGTAASPAIAIYFSADLLMA